MSANEVISKSIDIHAPLSIVWDVLTNPDLMKQWMAEPEMELSIKTDWKVGNPIVIKGFHHIKFENKGTVLQVEPHKVLRYNYVSSLSRLPDRPENYIVTEFRLAPTENKTTLTITLSNFATEAIYHHTDFYWKGTIEILRKFAEGQGSSNPADN